MEQVMIQSQSRKQATKSELKKSRKDGLIPGILYGRNETPQTIFVNSKEFGKILSKFRENVLLKIMLENKENKMAIIKEIQRNVLTNKPIHIDFLVVSMKEKIELDVPVRIIGEAPGVKNSGGILEHLLRQIRVRCLPADIPQSIQIDVSNLNLNMGVVVKDLAKIENVEFLADPNSIIVNVVAPTKVEEAATESVLETISPSEPEVITKGKKEEEGEAAAAAPGDKKAPAAGDKKAPEKGAEKPADKKDAAPEKK